MVKTYVEQTVSFGKDWVACLPPGLFICLSTAYIEGGRYFQSFRHEFVGTLLMIMCTFSAGKWVGRDNLRVAWTAHAMGVITADYLGGGPHVNPAVTTSMWALGKCSYTESYVRVSAQLAGGLVSFPIFAALAHAMDWDAFGGPEFHMSSDEYPTGTFSLLGFFSSQSLTGLLVVVLPKTHTYTYSRSFHVRIHCDLFTHVCHLYFELGNQLWDLSLHYQANLDGRRHSGPD